MDTNLKGNLKGNPSRRVAGFLLLAALAGCAADGRYYVKRDLSEAGMAGVTTLTRAAAPSSPLELGVTFKSGGRVVPKAGDTLYQMVQDGLSRRGGWSVRRIGDQGQDFAPIIAAIVAAPPAPVSVDGPAAVDPKVPRMMVLVEDQPDLSGGTGMDYFLSGMSIGVYGVRKAVDRYEVTIAYRDPSGLQRVYHSHQDLFYGTGLGSNSDDPVPAGLRRYDDQLAAFEHIVHDSLSGSRRGTVEVGQPRFTQAAATP